MKTAIVSIATFFHVVVYGGIAWVLSQAQLPTVLPIESLLKVSISLTITWVVLFYTFREWNKDKAHYRKIIRAKDKEIKAAYSGKKEPDKDYYEEEELDA